MSTTSTSTGSASAAPAPRVLLRVLFIDAGPTRSGWAILEVWSTGRLVPVQGGWCSMTDIAWLGALMEGVWAAGGVVALEYIDGALYDRARWRELGETQRVEGEIRAVARLRGAPHVLLPFAEMRAHRLANPGARTLYCVPATSWMAEVCQRSRPTNREVRVVVPYLCGVEVEVRDRRVRVLDLPAARGDAQPHILDACGGACVVGCQMLGVKFRIPDAVRIEQEQARARGTQRKSLAATLEKLGVDASRATLADGTPAAEVLGKAPRRESRGVRAGRRVSGANTKARKKGASR